jgi:hypothetical protein
MISYTTSTKFNSAETVSDLQVLTVDITSFGPLDCSPGRHFEGIVHWGTCPVHMTGLLSFLEIIDEEISDLLLKMQYQGLKMKRNSLFQTFL